MALETESILRPNLGTSADVPDVPPRTSTRMDGRTDGCSDRRTDGRTDGHALITRPAQTRNKSYLRLEKKGANTAHVSEFKAFFLSVFEQGNSTSTI